jgi:hypothetical protein
MRPFVLSAISSFGRSLLAVGLLAGALLHGSVSLAHAEGAVDLGLTLTLDPTSTNPGNDVVIEAFATHKGAETDGAWVEVYLPRRFSNVRVTSNGGFTCTISEDSAGTVWIVRCGKSSIAPGGQWFDVLQIGASAPSAAGSYTVSGKIYPMNADESNAADNHPSVALQVVNLIEPLPRHPLPITVAPEPVSVPKPSRGACVLLHNCK